MGAVVAERRASATEARVRFGELLDGVTSRRDIVFVERAGREVAVVMSLEDWHAASRGRSDRWARARASDERDQQTLDALR